MKRLYSIIMLLALLLQCGCADTVRISERAIVKAICLDYDNGEFIADIAVFTCEQNGSADEASEQAHIYNGRGADIASAINDCEIKQNKTPFYAQNELLFLTSKVCMEKGGDILEYFNKQSVMGQDLAIFVHRGIEALANGDNVADIIIDAQRLAFGSTETKGTKRLYEYRADGSAIKGYLPTVELSEDGCKDSGIIINSKFKEPVSKDLRIGKLVQLLDNRLKTIELWQTGSKADTLAVSYEVVPRDGEPYLTVYVSGSVHMSNSVKSIEDISAELESNLMEIINETFNEKNDIFNFCNLMRAFDTKKVDALINDGSMFKRGRVETKIKLVVA